jgi:hypothetical protein
VVGAIAEAAVIVDSPARTVEEPAKVVPDLLEDQEKDEKEVDEAREIDKVENGRSESSVDTYFHK